MDKKGFLLYLDYKEHLLLLSDEDRGKLLLALFEYAETGQIPELTGMVKMAFSFIRVQMDRDAQKYVDQCEKNRSNGTRGGRPSKKPSGLENNSLRHKETERFSEKPKETERFFEKPKKPDNDNDKDTDKDTDLGIENTDVFSSSERLRQSSENAVFSLPLNDKSEYYITQAMVDEWAELYPAVDVMQDLRAMKGWLNANPSKRKTRRGITKFVNGWLSRTQNQGGNCKQTQGERENGKSTVEGTFEGIQLDVTRL